MILRKQKKYLLICLCFQVLYGCNGHLKQSQLKAWFYNLPVYDRANNITKQLLQDNRFAIEEIPDTTKNSYVYKARIKNPDLPAGNGLPDSSVIDFTVLKIKNDSDSTISTLLSINHYFSNTADLEILYEILYKDLRSVFYETHDVQTGLGNDPIAYGKKIFYKNTKDISQGVTILKKKHPNGSRSLELTFMSGGQ